MIQKRMSRGTYMRRGSWFNKRVNRPTELVSSDAIGGGVGLRTIRTISSSVVSEREVR